MKRKFLIALIAMMLTIPVYASQSITVEAAINCGDWLKVRKANTAAFFEYSLIGLIDGLALGRGVEIWRANGIPVTRDQLYYWMDAYCQKNPLSMVITGAYVFANERSYGLFDKR